MRALLPPPLPPIPRLNLEALEILQEQANQAIGRLDGLASALPDIDLFLYGYIRKEAVLSSQIEGTQSSLSDLLLFEVEEAPGVPLDDVREVSGYVAALNHGMTRLREGFPLSLRLIREIHAVLLAGGRRKDKDPGEFRRSQNRIGGSRPGNAAFVPPPPDEVMNCMGSLENFLHDDSSRLPTLIKAGLIHVQFETIHPFLDGNGRLGRLLMTFLLCAAGIIREPILYLSLYLKANRQTYYDLLTKVRTDGAWEEWLAFFLEGVRQTSDSAANAARRMLALVARDRERIEASGRHSPSVLRAFQCAQRRPLLNAKQVASALGVSFPTASSALDRLQAMGILREITGRRRSRLYVYSDYLAILSEGTEPL